MCPKTVHQHQNWPRLAPVPTKNLKSDNRAPSTLQCYNILEYKAVQLCSNTDHAALFRQDSNDLKNGRI